MSTKSDWTWNKTQKRGINNSHHWTYTLLLRSFKNRVVTESPKPGSPVCMTTWVTSGVTWETTVAPMRLANFFTVICGWKGHWTGQFILLPGARRPDLLWAHTCWLGPKPDVTSNIRARLRALSGVLFSLSSWPSDGEPSLFRVFAAELNPTVLDILESLANKNRKGTIRVYVRILCSAAALLSSVMLLCLDPAGRAAPLPSLRLALASCSSSGKVSLRKRKKKVRQK